MVRVGFIGVGRMGSALLSGFIGKGLISASDVRAYDKNLSSVKRMNVGYEYSSFEVVEKSEVVFLCVKPKDMDDVLDEIRDIAGSRLIVSIAAGISLKRIESKLKEARVIRVMPNTPAMIQETAAAYSLGTLAREEDAMFVGSLLNSIGVAYRVEEKDLDAVTGLSGSGPAYVYLMIDALMEAGIKEGLDEEVALNLTLQTVRGAADMVAATNKSPMELIAEVKSPKGTTVEGLKVLEKCRVRKAFQDAVKAAAKRSRELGK
ncbi:MAG: pyrroline-5-carboxylate reductase [Candidatus Altiarchaeota archaeon]